MTFLLDRIVYEFRWWRWFRQDPFRGCVDLSPHDHESRMILFRRWVDSEPSFRGTFPNRLPPESDER